MRNCAPPRLSVPTYTSTVLVASNAGYGDDKVGNGRALAPGRVPFPCLRTVILDTPTLRAELGEDGTGGLDESLSIWNEGETLGLLEGQG